MPRIARKTAAPRVPETIELNDAPDESAELVVFGDDSEPVQTPEDKLLALVAEQAGTDETGEGTVTLFKFNDDKKRDFD